jgi:heptosyltransferase-2
MEIDSASIKKVLIRGTNWVGDAVMSVPAMREVRRRFPESRISLLIRPWARRHGGATSWTRSSL